MERFLSFFVGFLAWKACTVLFEGQKVVEKPVLIVYSDVWRPKSGWKACFNPDIAGKVAQSRRCWDFGFKTTCASIVDSRPESGWKNCFKLGINAKSHKASAAGGPKRFGLRPESAENCVFSLRYLLCETKIFLRAYKPRELLWFCAQKLKTQQSAFRLCSRDGRSCAEVAQLEAVKRAPHRTRTESGMRAAQATFCCSRILSAAYSSRSSLVRQEGIVTSPGRLCWRLGAC